jgi:elongation factor P--(R)-beta-lysine ligase
MDWQPTASLANLKLRAEVLKKIRTFFAERNILEVDTPLLSQATVTDLHLQSFVTQYFQEDKIKFKNLYLQTSPEFGMKRLLAADSGPIYQICKAFRNGGESGRLHNPEFTMLEWYRPGFDHHQLMDEMEQLLQLVLNTLPAERISYKDLFLQYVEINPHTASIEKLKNCLTGIRAARASKRCPISNEPLPGGRGSDSKYQTIEINLNSDDRNDYLHLLMSHIIEPNLGQNNKPTFVYDFPAAQAALAKIRHDDPLVAERFEVYINGIELANGFHELTDVTEQRKRFTNDLEQRKEKNYPIVPIDENLLTALAHGIPNCAGVALGIDRLIMLAAKTNNLADVVSFSLERA